MLQIDITAFLELPIVDVPWDLLQELKDENTFDNPKFAQLLKMKKLTYGTPRLIETYSVDGTTMFLPRGYYRTLCGKLEKWGLEFGIKNKTVCPEGCIPESDCDLYDFQAPAADNILTKANGILIAPTGTGKTNILLSVAARLKTNVIVIVHTTELLNQTIDRALTWLGIEAGQYGAGKYDLKPLTVAMIQTLARRDLKAEGLSDYFGAVFIDECHHSPAVTWAKVLQQFPAKYRYGFTATGWRKDGLGFLMWRLIGDRQAEITKEEAEVAGKLVWPDQEVVFTDYYHPIENSSEWSQMLGELVLDEARNEVIAKTVQFKMLPNTKALILTDRIAHANILAGLLEKFDPVLLTGELKKAERVEAMECIRGGAKLTVATTHLLGEGVDVPGWNLLFLASPIAGGPRTLQAVGRIARPAPGKDKATLVDFLDTRIEILCAAFRKRKALYE
jgi:superfamily II DNA or RNA helicase